MGWSSGTDIAITMITSIKENVNDPNIRKNLYIDLIDSLKSAGWDCQNEAYGIDPLADRVLRGKPNQTIYYEIYAPNIDEIIGVCTDKGVESVLKEEPDCELRAISKKQFDKFNEEN